MSDATENDYPTTEPIGGDIPKKVRNRIMSAEFTWVTNVSKEIYDPENTRMLSRHELGRPKATEVYSEAELIKMGMAGMYRRSVPS
jgi:hypothetical protein